MIKMMKWETYQHYRRSDARKYPPKWIKMFAKLLDDPDFTGMSETAQLLLVKLWLMASQARANDGEIAMNVIDVAWRLRMDEGLVYQTIIEIGEVADLKNTGQPQWLMLEKTPLDEELIRRLNHERQSLDVASQPSLENDDELAHHMARMAATSRPTPTEETPESIPSTGQRGGEERRGEDYSPEKSLDAVEKNDDDEKSLDPESEKELPKKTAAEVATAAAQHATWITPYLKLWEARWGAGSFPLGAALRPIGQLRAANGDPKTLAHFELYCQTKESEYATPANFQRSFEEWNPETQQASSLTPEMS